MKRSIPILLYHHVSPDRDITPDVFESQLRALLAQGYRSLSLEDVLRVIAGRSPANQRGFVVTFDDGYLDNWVYAFPILKKLNVKATIYVVTSYIERQTRPREDVLTLDTRTQEREIGQFLSWGEAREMLASGLVTFGSHTHTHRGWIRTRPYLDVKQELVQSKALVEAELRQPCHHIAWPWGEYEEAWWPILIRLGFRSAATVRSGANTNGINPFELQRIKVVHPSPQWLLSRIQWHSSARKAKWFGTFYGLDQRFKQWLKPESPYSHG
ncbi:MAG: polysaccharide deacetylase family protein [Elusimicrobiota bacterium]|jgi:peptidoglycan/xylan/chitin deacetylase (PgdA/CDA1 family)